MGGGIERRESRYVMGIDLGTSTSTISVYTGGKSKILKIEGSECMPSVVSYKDLDNKFIGEQAKSRMLLDPQNTVASIKRHMGDDEYILTIHEENFTPEQISAEILLKLVEEAMSQPDFDSEGNLRYAVICVPANFTENAKRATRKAAEIAGIKVLYLLEEPVAAALAYGCDKVRDQNILVYDLGGGTFDVSILKIDTKIEGKSQYRILAKEGIPYLGGDDFDTKLMEMINEDFKSKNNGLDLLDMERDQGINKSKMKTALKLLKENAEKAKIDLSEKDSVEIYIPHIIKNEEGEPLHVEIVITREQFESAISGLIDKTEETVKTALTSAGMSIEEIDRIILVGGSTLVPLVKNKIKELFGKEPYSDLNPWTIVAQGAAFFGGTLQGPGFPNGKEEIVIDGIVTHHLGIMSGMKFSKIIEKGTAIPSGEVVSVEKEYCTQYDNQTDLIISIYQCTEDIEFINEKEDGRNKAVFVGEFKLTGIRPAPKGVERILVRFEINDQNLLKVYAISKSNSENAEMLEMKPE